MLLKKWGDWRVVDQRHMPRVSYRSIDFLTNKTAGWTYLFPSIALCILTSHNFTRH